MYLYCIAGYAEAALQTSTRAGREPERSFWKHFCTYSNAKLCKASIDQVKSEKKRKNKRKTKCMLGNEVVKSVCCSSGRVMPGPSCQTRVANDYVYENHFNIESYCCNTTVICIIFCRKRERGRKR